MGRDRLLGRVEETEDTRSQNTKTAQELERSFDRLDQTVEEESEHFDSRRVLEDQTSIYEPVDDENLDLEEQGVPEEPNEVKREVDNCLKDQLGYNPDTEDYATFGEIEVIYDQGFIDVFYETTDNLVSVDGSCAPLLQEAGPEIMEKTLSADVPHTNTANYERKGRNGVQFRYDERDWIAATEEVGDAITKFEEEVGLADI